MQKNRGHRARRLLSLILCLALTAIPFVMPAKAIEDPKIEGEEHVYLYNFDYDTVLFHTAYTDETARDISIFPASTVKLMTGLIACEKLADRLGETIRVTGKMLDGVKGNNMALQVGENVKIEDMIYGLLTNCANDAAQVLAVLISGSVEDFVAEMNEKARFLGMYNTFYVNPTGMHDDKMVTTLRDTAILAKECYKNDLLVNASSEIKHVVDSTNKTQFRNLYNRNCLISTFYNTSGEDYRYTGVRGLNAGYTPRGGYCCISTVTRNNLTYLCIVMNGKEDAKKSISSYTLTRSLYDWAFASYQKKTVLTSGTIVTEMPVTLSSTVDYIQLIADLGGEEALYCYIPTDVNVATEITYSWYTFEESLQAPVKKGTVVGNVTVLYHDEVIGTASLVTSTDLDRSEFLYFLSRIQAFTSTKFFLVTIISFVALFALYIIAEATREERKAKRKRPASAPVSISFGRKNQQKKETGGRKSEFFEPGMRRTTVTQRVREKTEKETKNGGGDPPVNPSRR
ncbi:MAG: D-alanyl-D-alanine carboxypeptidase [Clostridia bacterium]|nr:D-alanyl-D-alanine carboxypeptidase [Clostridia bacterium]